MPTITHQRFKFVLLALLLPLSLWAMNAPAGHNISINITTKDSKEAIFMASCSLKPIGLVSSSNVAGQAFFSKIPSGNYLLEVSYLGFETYRTQVKVEKDLSLSVQLLPSSLALKEVVVTAKQSANTNSTASVIGKQAIEHLQATSLADVMQLIPGQRMGNTDPTQQQNLQIRTLTNNNTSAFGSSVIIDGMPISNNGTVSQGAFSATTFVGTDLRQVSADNIEQVEVVRGIPSAEYGDLTSGLVIVQSKVGVSPFQARAKYNPSLQNYSLSKGLHIANLGIFNFNGDYAKAWGDPRLKTRSYDRYTFNVGYGAEISKNWRTDTKLRVLYMKDWSGNDPDAIDDGTYYKNSLFTLGLTHNGRIAVNKLLMRTLSYTIGASYSSSINHNTSFVSAPNAFLPILTARETGYHKVNWLTSSYLGSGRTESSPFNIFAKINNAFYVRTNKTTQSFKLGAEYKYDVNHGKGYFNIDETHPLRPNNNGRPRAFSDIPGIHQFSAYLEDKFTWNISKTHRLQTQAGVRFTSAQPFSNLATTALSPRLNVSLNLTKNIELRGGIGLNSKTPSLDYLYPDKRYIDRVAANYISQTNPEANLVMYHTQVINVKPSTQLKNATTTKIELGLDVKLKGNRKLSILAYRDKTPNGFGALRDYLAYETNLYNATMGLNFLPNGTTEVDFNNPFMRQQHLTSSGKIGNTNTTINKGIEFDFDFGSIKALNTSIFFSGAYAETKTWNNDLNTSSVRSALLPTNFTSYGLTPFITIYPSATDHDTYRRFINTLRLVTNIPTLRMVASFTTQAIWYNYNRSFYATKEAQGWINMDLSKHYITNDMREGYIGLNGNYYASLPADVQGIKITDLTTRESDNRPTKAPINWNISARLTKELGKNAGLSFYVNNMMFYEPFLSGNRSNTLSQRNTGTFNYGVELYINL